MCNCKLHRYNEVPHIFFEPYIVRGYRSCPSSLASCLASAFQPNNEAFNFWTHFLPILPFIVIIIDNVFDDRGIDDPFQWPLIVFLLSVCCYMLASAVAHLFNNMSVRHRYVMFFIDYCGVSINIFGSSVAYNAYVFPKELVELSPFLHRVYLPLSVLTAFFSTFLASASRFATGHMLHYGRLPAFMIPFFWGSIPVFFRVAIFAWTWLSGQPVEGADAMFYHVSHLSWITLAAVFYGTRFPECVFPGHFDVIGHSHQFFHIAIALCSYTQYLALKLDIDARRDFLMESFGEPTFGTSFGPFLTVLLVNFVIIWAVSYKFLPSSNADILQVNSTKAN